MQGEREGGGGGDQEGEEGAEVDEGVDGGREGGGPEALEEAREEGREVWAAAMGVEDKDEADGREREQDGQWKEMGGTRVKEDGEKRWIEH